MNSQPKNKLINEIAWLLGILIASAIIEYVIIVMFDLHPILSVKIQGVIGLTIIAYGIRMAARLGSNIQTSADQESNGQGDIETH